MYPRRRLTARAIAAFGWMTPWLFCCRALAAPESFEVVGDVESTEAPLFAAPLDFSTAWLLSAPPTLGVVFYPALRGLPELRQQLAGKPALKEQPLAPPRLGASVVSSHREQPSAGQTLQILGRQGSRVSVLAGKAMDGSRLPVAVLEPEKQNDGGAVEAKRGWRRRHLIAYQRAPLKARILIQPVVLDRDVSKTKNSKPAEEREFAEAIARRNERVIAVTSLPVAPEVQELIVQGRPDARKILKRTDFIALNEADDGNTELNIAQKLLLPENDSIMREIARRVEDLRSRGFQVVIEGYNASPELDQVAERLGVPVNDALSEDVAKWNKTAGRRLFKDAGFQVIEGIDGIPAPAGLDGLADAIFTLLSQTGDRTVLLQTENGASGQGNLRLHFPGPITREVVGRRIRGLAASRRRGKLFQAFLRAGGIVARYIEDVNAFPSPSIIVRKTPNGKVRMLAAHKQILTKEGVFVGSSYPVSPRLRRRLRAAALRIGHALDDDEWGVFGVDFIELPLKEARRYGLTPTEEDIQYGSVLVPVDFNKRKTGTYYPFQRAKRLTGARVRGGVLERNRQTVAYVAHGNEKHFPGLVFADPGRFKKAFEASGLAYDHASARGIALNSVSAIFSPHTKGDVSFQAIARSVRAAKKLAARFTEWLRGLEVELVLERFGYGNLGTASPSPQQEVQVIRGALTLESLERVKAGAGAVHLVLDNGWLERRGDQLLVRRSLFFDPVQRRFVLTRHSKPLHASYYIASARNGTHLADGLEIASAAPTMNDRLRMRALAQEEGIDVPPTLYFPGRAYRLENPGPDMTPDDSGDAQDGPDWELIRGQTAQWIQRHEAELADKVVVRTALGNKARVFDHAGAQTNEIADYVQELLDLAGDHGVVMLESAKTWEMVLDVAAVRMPTGLIRIYVHGGERKLREAEYDDDRKRLLLREGDPSRLRKFDAPTAQNAERFRQIEENLNDLVQRFTNRVRATEVLSLPKNVRTDFFRLKVALEDRKRVPVWVLLDGSGQEDPELEDRRRDYLFGDEVQLRRDAQGLAVPHAAAMSQRAQGRRIK